jgi:hypothetical protein
MTFDTNPTFAFIDLSHQLIFFLMKQGQEAETGDRAR